MAVLIRDRADQHMTSSRECVWMHTADIVAQLSA
jgi:hypothetical protein